MAETEKILLQDVNEASKNMYYHILMPGVSTLPYEIWEALEELKATWAYLLVVHYS